MSTFTTTPEQQAWMEEMQADREATMHPDLVPYVGDTESGFTMLRHPLVYAVAPLPGTVNRMYEQKKEALAQAIRDEDWHSVLFLHERPYRTWALIEYAVGRDEEADEVLSLSSCPQDVIDLAADVWCDSENIDQHLGDWAEMFDAPGFFFASEEERAEFEALPQTLTVYRGVCDDGDWSWTLDRKIAEFFASRWRDEPGEVVVGTVDKADVFGYLSRRNESEVLARAGSVTITKSKKGTFR